MIYIRIILLLCICLTSHFSLTYTKPNLDLRQKLERLLQDPDYKDYNNEIQKPRQIHGMLLKDLREHGLFDTSSEERFFKRLRTFEKAKSLTLSTRTMTRTSTTTTSAPTELGYTTTETALSEQKPSRVAGGIGRLGSIISRFIDMWRY